MRARWFVGAVLTCCVTAADGPAPRRLAEYLSGNTPLISDVQELCDRIGGRMTGSENCNRAIEWGAAKFKEIGVDRVATEEFTVPHRWVPVAAEARVVKPAVFPLRIAAAPFTPSTPGGAAIEARVVIGGEGTAEDFAKLGPKARGA